MNAGCEKYSNAVRKIDGIRAETRWKQTKKIEDIFVCEEKRNHWILGTLASLFYVPFPSQFRLIGLVDASRFRSKFIMEMCFQIIGPTRFRCSNNDLPEEEKIEEKTALVIYGYVIYSSF